MGDGSPEELNLIHVFLLCWFDFKRYSSSVSETVTTFVLPLDLHLPKVAAFSYSPEKKKKLEKMQNS